jgi:antibiotic biosynthesis monooxygenase (ABM) superfamily enzyme
MMKETLTGTAPFGPATQAGLLGISIFMAIPYVLVFLSLVLTPKLNKWANINLVLIYTVIVIRVMFMGVWLTIYSSGL